MHEGWRVVPATEQHESGIVYFWVKGLARSRYGRHRGADQQATPAELGFWDEHAPIVEYLLPRSEVRVVTDDGAPGSILAFSASTDDAVHWVAFKRSAVQLGFAPDLARLLLDGREERACTTTLPIPAARTKEGLVAWQPPRHWVPDPTWWARRFVEPRMGR